MLKRALILAFETNGVPNEPGARPIPGSGDGEPAFNAPWPALLLSAGLIALYAWQATFPDQAEIYDRFGLIPGAPGEGRRLVTALFVHGGWAHVILNAVGALAFGSGVARLFGTGPAGAVLFMLFYLLCGALSGWGYLALQGEAPVVLIGASGAVAGLMGGASRLIDRRAVAAGRLAPFLSAGVISMAVGWIVVNLLVAVTGLAPGVGAVPVAWEAHLAGYAAGLLLVGPAAWLLRLPSKGARKS